MSGPAYQPVNYDHSVTQHDEPHQQYAQPAYHPHNEQAQALPGQYPVYYTGQYYNGAPQPVMATPVPYYPGTAGGPDTQSVVAVPVSYAAPRSIGTPGHLPRTGRWSDGIFNCFDGMGICILSLFVPCYRWALTMDRTKLMAMNKALLMMGIPWILIWVLNIAQSSSHNEYIVLGMIPCQIFTIVLGTMYRGKIRATYGIEGSDCEDCLMHTFCNCCAVAQEARHVDRDLAIPI